jgi:Cu-Zn family superoxide dismutase
MVRKAIAGVLLGLSAFVGFAAHAQDRAPDLTAALVDVGGNPAGNIDIYVAANGLLLRATFTGIDAGVHGFHIHQTGLCEAPPRLRPEDPLPFRSAGSHLNPDAKQHGFLNDAGPHAGDLPNIIIPETGEVTVDLFVPGLDPSTLMDADGAAFILHAGADDYTTDTTGGAGGRIACGVIH